MYIRQGTTTSLKIGPFLDKTDGFTAETGLTITQSEIKLSKNAGAISQKSASGGATHDQLGYYSFTLDGTDTESVGRLTVLIHETGEALPVWENFTVLPAKVYDSIVLGIDKLEVDTVLISGVDALGVLTKQDTIKYINHNGNDIYSGNILRSGVHSSSFGSLVNISPGLYNLTGNSITVPAGVKLVGAGRGLTEIISSGVPNGVGVMKTLDDCELRDMTINGLRGNEGVGGGVGLAWLASSHIGFHGYNLHVIGQNDSMIYVPVAGSRGEIYFENCRFESRNVGYPGTTDNVIVTPVVGSTLAVFKNCEVYTDGRGGTGEATGIKGGGNGTTILRFIDGYVECRNDSGNSTAFRVDSSAGMTEFMAYNTSFYSYTQTGTARDLHNVDAESILGVGGCNYNRLKTAGNIYVIGISQTGVAKDVWDRPTAGHTTGGTFGYLLPAEHNTTQDLALAILLQTLTSGETVDAVTNALNAYDSIAPKVEFVGDYNGNPCFYRKNGQPINSYYALMDTDSRIYTSGTFIPYDISQVSNTPLWNQVRLFSTTLADANSDPTPYHYINNSGNFSGNLNPGFYYWLALSSNEDDADLIGNFGSYYDGSKWWPIEQSIKTKTDYLPSATAGTSTGLALVNSLLTSGNTVHAVTAALNTYDPPTKAELDARTLPSGEYNSITSITETGIADAVWARPTAGYNTLGTFGKNILDEHAETQSLLVTALINIGTPLQSGDTYTAITSNGSLDVTFN